MNRKTSANVALALASSALMAVASTAVAETVTSTVIGPDTLNIIDVRDPQADGTIRQAVSEARDVTFRSKLKSDGSLIEDGFSDARYEVTISQVTGNASAVNLTAPIGVLGTGGALMPELGNSRVQTNLSSNAGRFNTTPGTPSCERPDPFVASEIQKCNARWFETNGSFEIDFGGDFGAFGFYGTDFGDFGGSLILDLLGGNDLVQIVLSGFDSNTDRAAMFFGFYDTANLYSGVRIRVQQTGDGSSDFFGFDDLILGQVGSTDPDPNPVPEPGSLALVGASLLALAAARRRRKG